MVSSPMTSGVNLIVAVASSQDLTLLVRVSGSPERRPVPDNCLGTTRYVGTGRSGERGVLFVATLVILGCEVALM